MFGKVIVFELFEMIFFLSEDRIPGSGFDLQVGSGTAARAVTVRFLSCAIMLVSKLSLVIRLTILDIVDPDRLAHVILFDWIKQWIL